ncbi:hypothetical protein DFH09DRAFT_58859 [Mycena vulgaris]|nr:hypothetical protein DFH09DRAFT_58859 [Mycena vulgaris]
MSSSPASAYATARPRTRPERHVSASTPPSSKSGLPTAAAATRPLRARSVQRAGRSRHVSVGGSPISRAARPTCRSPLQSAAPSPKPGLPSLPSHPPAPVAPTPNPLPPHLTPIPSRRRVKPTPPNPGAVAAKPPSSTKPCDTSLTAMRTPSAAAKRSSLWAWGCRGGAWRTSSARLQLRPTNSLARTPTRIMGTTTGTRSVRKDVAPPSHVPRQIRLPPPMPSHPLHAAGDADGRWGIRLRERHLPARRRPLARSLLRRLLCAGVVHVPRGLRAHPRSTPSSSSLPPPLAFPGPHPSSPSHNSSGTLAESATSTVVPTSPKTQHSPSQNDSSAYSSGSRGASASTSKPYGVWCAWVGDGGGWRSGCGCRGGWECWYIARLVFICSFFHSVRRFPLLTSAFSSSLTANLLADKTARKDRVRGNNRRRRERESRREREREQVQDEVTSTSRGRWMSMSCPWMRTSRRRRRGYRSPHLHLRPHRASVPHSRHSCLGRRRRARTLHASASCRHTQVPRARVQHGFPWGAGVEVLQHDGGVGRRREVEEERGKEDGKRTGCGWCSFSCGRSRRRFSICLGGHAATRRYGAVPACALHRVRRGRITPGCGRRIFRGCGCGGARARGGPAAVVCGRGV